MSDFQLLEKIITERRSIKPTEFNGSKIEKAQIESLLAMADWAPTHGLTEPWRFVIMANEAVNRFCMDHARMYKENTSPENFKQVSYDKFLTQGEKASHIIAVFSSRGERAGILVQEEICATACAMQNILLSATAMGIASFWSTGGQILQPAMKSYFQLREQDTMLGVLYLGYSDKTISPGKRITPLLEKQMWYNR